ncbi:Uncharacterised protein [Bordetella pertussis]|nr:Uncharacterised protein [Bordetella pertussis]
MSVAVAHSVAASMVERSGSVANRCGRPAGKAPASTSDSRPTAGVPSAMKTSARTSAPSQALVQRCSAGNSSSTRKSGPNDSSSVTIRPGTISRDAARQSQPPALAATIMAQSSQLTALPGLASLAAWPASCATQAWAWAANWSSCASPPRPAAPSGAVQGPLSQPATSWTPATTVDR